MDFSQDVSEPNQFLVAYKRLYKRVCPSVGPLVRLLVRNAFVKIAENGVMPDGDASYVVYTALFNLLSFLNALSYKGGTSVEWTRILCSFRNLYIFLKLINISYNYNRFYNEI